MSVAAAKRRGTTLRHSIATLESRSVTDEKRNEQRPAAEDQPEDLEVPEEQADEVRGGKTPSPGGPVPIPYPN
jgi:hypothetical protein